MYSKSPGMTGSMTITYDFSSEDLMTLPEVTRAASLTVVTRIHRDPTSSCLLLRSLSRWWYGFELFRSDEPVSFFSSDEVSQISPFFDSTKSSGFILWVWSNYQDTMGNQRDTWVWNPRGQVSMVCTVETRRPLASPKSTTAASSPAPNITSAWKLQFHETTYDVMI